MKTGAMDKSKSLMLCRPCKTVLEAMIVEEEVGLRNANMERSLVLQCFYAGRLALLIDLVRGTSTKPEDIRTHELVKT